MFYVVGALVGIWVLWALSEWYTERKIDIIVRRVEELERRPQLLLVTKKHDNETKNGEL